MIYWIAESWDNPKCDSIKKSWKSLWPDITNAGCYTLTEEPTETDEIMKQLGYGEAEANDVSQWVTTGKDYGHQNYRQ